jgi:amidase
MSSELLAMSALGQARLISEGKLSSVELVKLYLDRIDRHDGGLGAFVQVLHDNALGWAAKKDAAPREGRPPFHGVPTGIKDVNLARGTFTRMGSKAFSWLWSPVDDVTTRSVRQAGFVILGKLATSELGVMPITETDLHPPARNPWNRDHTPGGSSGGSGTAVAAGLLPIAQGSDGAGSIRIPSSFCGLVGHKLSRGLLPNPYKLVDPIDMTTVGPLARSVDDCAAMLEAMGAGALLAASRQPPGPLKIRFTTLSSFGAATPEIAAVVEATVKRLEGLGHHVEGGATPQGTVAEFLPIWQRQVARVPLARAGSLQPVTRWIREAGKSVTDAQVAKRHLELSARVIEWFGDADVWVTPTVAVAPPRVGEWKGLAPDETFSKAAVLGMFTALFNLTGQPATSVPVAVSQAGLPIGVQLVGRRGTDGRLLALARQLEQLAPVPHVRDRFV